MSDFIDSLYADVIKMATGLVIKREDLADAEETTESARDYERYMSLLRDKRDFKTFATFDIDILEKFLPPDLIADAHVNPSTIPTQYRTTIMEAQYDRYFTHYEEKNNYYRMLNGKPNLNDTGYVYISDMEGVDPNTPVHLLSDEALITAYYNGKLDELIAKYPNKKYIRHLGHKRIDIFKARRARHLDILSIPEPKSQLSKELFLKEYYKTKHFHMATLYAKHIFRSNDLYDGMFGFLITCAAIRATMTVDQNLILTNEAIEKMLESYGLEDYFAYMPIVYKKKFIQNIDKLISVKGTDQVLIDICDIFGYNNITANRYYIMKRHSLDVAGKPIFPKLPDGSPDYEKQYNLAFLKTNIEKGYIENNAENIVPYETLTESDALWQMDTQELNELKKEEFNLMMSKYIGIEAAYNVTQLVYETTYFLNLMLDSRHNAKLTITNSYSSASQSDTFTSLIFLFAAMSKLSGFDGNIFVEPAHVAQVFRFNLDIMRSTIEEVITRNKLNITVDDVMLTKPIGIFDDAQYLTTIYIKNSSIYEKLNAMIAETTDLNTFNGLKELKEVLFVSTQSQKCFTMSNGQIAKTYLEMLKDIDISLFDAINNMNGEVELEGVITYVLNNLQTLFDTDVLKFLFINTPDMHDKLIKGHFRKMVDLFKASPVQIGSIDIFFKITDSGNPMRSFCKYFTNTFSSYEDRTVNSSELLGTHYEIVIKDDVYTWDNCKIHI